MSKIFSVSRKDCIAILLTVFFMFFGRFIPAPESYPITQYGIQVVMIFIGLIIGWCFSSLFWPSVLAIVALSLTPYGAASKVVSAAFSNSTIIMVLLGFICFAPMTYSGVGNVLCYKLLSLKFFKGKPYILIFSLMMGLFILSGINALPAPLIVAVITLLGEMCKSIGYKKEDKFPAFFLMGIMLIICCGRTMLPFMPWSLQTVGTLTHLQPLSYTTFWAMVIPGTILIAILYIFAMKLLRCNFSLLKIASIDIDEGKTKMNEYQKGVFAFTMLVVIMLVIVGVFAKANGSFFQVLLNNIGVIGVNAFGIFLGVILHIDGEPIINMRKAYEYMCIPIDVIIMVAIAILISSILTSEGTGVTETLSIVLSPLLVKSSGYTFILTLTLATFVLTNLANNMVIAYTMLAVLNTIYSIDPSFNLTVAGTLIAFTSITGILLPSASFYGAIIYSNDMVSSQNALFSGLVALIVTSLIIAIYMVPIGLLV